MLEGRTVQQGEFQDNLGCIMTSFVVRKSKIQAKENTYSTGSDIVDFLMLCDNIDDTSKLSFILQGTRQRGRTSAQCY